MSDDMKKVGDKGTRLGAHNHGKPSLGKALGHGIVRHAVARHVAAIAVPVTLSPALTTEYFTLGGQRRRNHIRCDVRQLFKHECHGQGNAEVPKH